MKSKSYLLIFASALLLACSAGAQQAPPTKTDPPKPKAKRVWTNEDMGSVRKVADVYEDDKAKAADEEAARKKAEAAKASAKTPGDKEEAKPDYLPKTVEEAEKLVAKKQYEIDQQYEAIDLVKKEQEQAKSDESRAAFQKRIDTLTATLDEAVAELRAIDERLKELKAKPPAPAKAEAPKPETPKP